MNEKQANISQSFENKILNLLKSKASGFRSSRALSEGLLSSGVGAGLGAANELRKDLSGEQGETSPEEKVNRYLHGALGGAATGAAFGGLKGAVKGKQMLADAARKEMSGMSPFIGEQLAKGVGEGKILSQLKNLKNMHVSEHLDEGSFAGKLQSLFSGSAPEQKGGLFSKAPKSFDDIVRETTEKEQMQAAKRLADQESTLARQARKEEETALKAQQKLEREKTRKGSLGGELASAEKGYTEALGKAEKNIRDPKALQSLESAGKQRMNAVLGEKLFKEYQNALNSGDIARANQVMGDLQKAMVVPPQEGLYSKIKNYLTKRPTQTQTASPAPYDAKSIEKNIADALLKKKNKPLTDELAKIDDEIRNAILKKDNQKAFDLQTRKQEIEKALQGRIDNPNPSFADIQRDQKAQAMHAKEMAGLGSQLTQEQNRSQINEMIERELHNYQLTGDQQHIDRIKTLKSLLGGGGKGNSKKPKPKAKPRKPKPKP